MAWMADTSERRADPRALWPEVRSIVLLGVNYGPAEDPRATLDRPEAVGEAFNVVDGLDTSWGRFLDDIGAGLGYPRPWIKLSYRVAFALAVGFEESYRALRRLTGLRTPPLLTRAAVQILGIDQDFSNAKLRRVLGWQPRVDYEHGLAATIAWLRDEYLPSL